MITGLVFGILPFLISYYFVAIAFIWDWILVSTISAVPILPSLTEPQFFIWSAVFATIHNIFGNDLVKERFKTKHVSGVASMTASQWLDLTVMLLFLASAIMGPVCLLLDRKSLFASRAVV